MNKRPGDWYPSRLTDCRSISPNDLCFENNFYRSDLCRSNTGSELSGGCMNHGFQISDGYQIYTGTKCVPVTQPPVPFEDGAIVMPNEFLSKTVDRHYNTVTPTEEIELKALGRMSQIESVKDVELRNTRDDVQRQQYRSFHHDMGKHVEETKNSSTRALKNEFDVFEHGRGVCLSVLKLITIIVTVWDMVIDWIVVIKFDEHTCNANTKFTENFFSYNTCGWEREKIRQVIAIFSMIGSIIGALQIINITLEILHNWGLVTFRLCHAQYDLFISLYFEEIPQAIILLLFSYNCICDLQGRLFSLVAIVSGFVSCIFRYGSSFRSMGGDSGCCNIWWRCCCCRQQQFLCNCGQQECCCQCDIPCPVFCCTLSCDNCRWTTHTWCAGWMKMLSCFCSCCLEDYTMFGVRVMNNIGLTCLFCCLIATGTLWGMIPNLS